MSHKVNKNKKLPIHSKKGRHGTMYLVLSDEDSVILQLRCDNHGIRIRHTTQNVVVDIPHLDTITLLRSLVYDVLANTHSLLRKPAEQKCRTLLVAYFQG